MQSMCSERFELIHFLVCILLQLRVGTFFFSFLLMDAIRSLFFFWREGLGSLLTLNFSLQWSGSLDAYLRGTCFHFVWESGTVGGGVYLCVFYIVLFYVVFSV